MVLAYQLQIPVIGAFTEMIASIIAVGFGILEAIAGRNYQTWDPAKSRE
jgi:hypothetical protein